MAYVRHHLAALIETRPDEARAAILDAYEKARVSQKDAATLLDVSVPTLIRWTKQLDEHYAGLTPKQETLSKAIQKLRSRAAKDGWAHGRVNQHVTGEPERKTSKR